MRPLATLNVALYGAGPLCLELIQQSVNELSLARMPYAEVRMQPQIIATLAARIRSVVEGRVAASAGDSASRVQRADPLVASGRGLFDEIMPSRQPDVHSIREPLCDLKTALLVATNIPEIPWELLYDGTDFLGLRYEMGRSLRARGPEWRPPEKNSDWQCLLIADPTGDLPTAREEALAVKESLESRGIVCDYLADQQATFENVLHSLNSSQYDIIHYSGHIGRDEESHEYGFILRNAEFFTASAIKTHVKTPAIAFLNGCNSGEVVQGLTEAFLATGAQMVIGSLYSTPSRGAAAFAKKFYADFLRGVSAGESMRQARLHVRELANCGTAWACFVMYGDPRFSLGLESDELDTWLGKAGFERSGFDSSAIKVLQQALAYGAVSEGVSTAILFAALLEGDDPFLRQKLEQCQVLELLEGAFKMALKSGEKGSGSAAGTEPENLKENHSRNEPSAHVIDILRRANEISRAKGLEKITELSLASGFAREGVGGAWTILRSLGIKPMDLDPWRDAALPRRIRGIGELTPEDCSSPVWEILLGAARHGLQGTTGGVSATHLFRAMADRPEGLVVATFNRLGLRITSGRGGRVEQTDAVAFHDQGEKVLCSSNVADILERAQSAARGRKVEEVDLLTAFIENGGGTAGAWLCQQGLPPRMLNSRLFLDGGALDTGRFDESGQKVLDEAIEFARQREYATLGGRHLLYGLLAASGSFQEELRKQGHDAEMLAEGWFAIVGSAHQGTLAVVPGWGSFSSGLLKALCDAEALAKSEGYETIGDKHLGQAWCTDDEGSGRMFLVQQRVRVTKMFK